MNDKPKVDPLKKATRAQHAAEARIRDLEAQCAAMSVALNHAWAAIGDRMLAGGPLSVEYAGAVQRDIDAAISFDAGRKLLERVEALERVAVAARVVEGLCGQGGQQELQATLAALDALEAKR